MPRCQARRKGPRPRGWPRTSEFVGRSGLGGLLVSSRAHHRAVGQRVMVEGGGCPMPGGGGGGYVADVGVMCHAVEGIPGPAAEVDGVVARTPRDRVLASLERHNIGPRSQGDLVGGAM